MVKKFESDSKNVGSTPTVSTKTTFKKGDLIKVKRSYQENPEIDEIAIVLEPLSKSQEDTMKLYYLSGREQYGYSIFDFENPECYEKLE